LPARSARLSEQDNRPRRAVCVSDYVPLLALIAVSLAAALSIAAGFGGAVGMSMHAWMGFSLCSFAMLKLFDLPRFAEGFRMYDLLAQRWRGYGFVYPFLELGLGLAYFAYFAPVQVYFATAIVFTFSIVGVISALDRGLDIDCPCMGTSLRVPLSTVTLVESATMVIMALAMLWM